MNSILKIIISLFVFISVNYDVFSQNAEPSPSIIVRAQKKPGEPWKDYSTLTLQQLKRFSMGSVDNKLDGYGGRSDIKKSSKGFFYVEKIGDRWWMIDPEGSLYFNKAVVSVSFGKSKISTNAVKLVYGGEKEWADATTKMLIDNGFNGTGAWSVDLITKEANPRVSYTTMLNFMSGYGSRRGGTYQQAGHMGYPEDCIFVFDPEFESFCDERASKLTDTKDDPYLLGYFSDNELPFPEDALNRFLQLSKREPGYKAAEQWLKNRKGGSVDTTLITDEDRAAFLELVADTYFKITSQAIIKYDPNHMFLGSRFHGKTLKQQRVFKAAGRYVDVISVNYYNTWTPDVEKMQDWTDLSGRPLLITEWYVKGADAGLPNESGAGWIVPTQMERGLFYQHFALNLLQFKNCVGWQWFKYIDNDPQATDADPSNSDSNKGIVTIHFQPYTSLLDKMRELNFRVYHLIDFFDNASK